MRVAVNKKGGYGTARTAYEVHFRHGPRRGDCVGAGSCWIWKTSLLLLYSAWVKEDPQRGQARLIDASRREIKGVIEFLDDAAHESIAAVRPLLGLDNVSVKNKDEAQELASAVRACREAGCEIVLACEPGQVELVTVLGDSARWGQGSCVCSRRICDVDKDADDR